MSVIWEILHNTCSVCRPLLSSGAHRWTIPSDLHIQTFYERHIVAYLLLYVKNKPEIITFFLGFLGCSAKCLVVHFCMTFLHIQSSFPILLYCWAGKYMWFANLGTFPKVEFYIYYYDGTKMHCFYELWLSNLVCGCQNLQSTYTWRHDPLNCQKSLFLFFPSNLIEKTPIIMQYDIKITYGYFKIDGFQLNIPI